mmetsp:Transcript_2211/g.3981  ORF Transcript_2211/g.3981 Transcript_2211/m.3981 type:complete len:88 (+) Transcript_2211:184-447(+)
MFLQFGSRLDHPIQSITIFKETPSRRRKKTSAISLINRTSRYALMDVSNERASYQACTLVVLEEKILMLRQRRRKSQYIYLIPNAAN